ncbi:hypothetical protein DFH06DRAFT_553940 [Mycena polygramma]|nr:hypothetical protein DFH06DRAFT_553940 [Mycena polygramma]
MTSVILGVDNFEPHFITSSTVTRPHISQFCLPLIGMQAEYNVTSDTFNRDGLIADLSGTCGSVLVYGFYLNLFVFAVYTLKRRKTSGKQVLLAFNWIMALLGTTQIVLRLIMATMTVRFLLQFIERGTESPLNLRGAYNSLYIAQEAIFAINNLVVDALFLFRCYVIWGSQWKVVILPALLILCTFVMGCVAVAGNDVSKSTSSILQTAPFIMAAITNLVLVLLTAGRLWWIRRAAVHIEDTKDLQNRYSHVISMILESGALYCICTILLIVTYPLGLAYFVLAGIATHFINIVPTLIIVRVGLGHDTVENRAPNLNLCQAAAPSRGISTFKLENFKDMDRDSVGEHARS